MAVRAEHAVGVEDCAAASLAERAAGAEGVEASTPSGRGPCGGGAGKPRRGIRRLRSGGGGNARLSCGG